MSMAKRVGDVEDNFTPKEAVICWMREAHRFDSLLTYGRWLLDQPEDAYPLIRMPRQVVAAVRRKNKGTPDLRLREQFYRVQKDTLFLYHLHKQVNLQALQEEEALHLRLELLNERLRSLIYHIAVVDGRRLEALKLPDEVRAAPPRRRRKKSTEEIELEGALAAWSAEEMLLRGEILAFQEAERLISRRYFGGEDLLFPQSVRTLQVLGEHLAALRDIYRMMIDRRPPESEEGFLRWVLEKPTPESPDPAPVALEVRIEEPPDTRRAARTLAEHHVLIAKSEALDALGERNAGVRLVEDWMRSQDR